jgi:mannosyltransferase OCH1-like enzyme
MIPHVIHFTVPKVIRPEQQDAINLAREKHPGWEIKVWQDPLDPSSHRLAEYWPYANSGAQLADLIRLEVIFEHGGVYLDSDFRICKSLADIADNCDFFVGSEDGQVLTNAVFGAKSGHPALGALIEDLLRTVPDWTLAPCITTGPQFFARVLKWRKDINVLPRAAFYLYNWNERIQLPHPAAYGTHHWAWSWKTAQAEETDPATKGFNPRRLLWRGISRLRDRIIAASASCDTSQERSMATAARTLLCAKRYMGRASFFLAAIYRLRPRSS